MVRSVCGVRAQQLLLWALTQQPCKLYALCAEWKMVGVLGAFSVCAGCECNRMMMMVVVVMLDGKRGYCFPCYCKVLSARWLAERIVGWS